MDYINIYYGKIPHEAPCDIPICKSRENYVNTFTNCCSKKQRYWASVLLETALKMQGVSVADANLRQTDSGKWVCDKVYFSITHSQNLVAVSVSQVNNGVDVEFFNKARFNTRLVNKLLNSNELLTPINELTPELLISLWTKKESIFKLGVPDSTIKTINPSDFKTKTWFISVGDEQYCLSSATHQIEGVQFVEPKEITLY